jgi:hypothetical protein
MRCCSSVSFVAAGLIACIAAGAFAVRSADSKPQDVPDSAPAPKPGPGGKPDLGPMLVGGLKATPGCLGVDTAKFSGGKNTIFAWFENREAVLHWYYKDVHQAAMATFFPGHKPERKPLEGIPEDYTGPILAIAAITFASPEEQQKTGRPFSQISIELYAPLKGGLAINGTLAPAAMKVEGGVDLTKEYAGKANQAPAQQ